MNSLIVLEQEVREEGLAVLVAQRAQRAYELHQLRPGITVKAMQFRGLRGQAEVLEADPNKVVLRVEFLEAAPARTELVLIVAVPRPQTVKKIIRFASNMGLPEVHFIRSYHVVKSYLQSKSLEPENVLTETVNGLEQAYDPVPPLVRLHNSFGSFVSEELPLILAADAIGLGARLIAHTRVGAEDYLDRSIPCDRAGRVYLAVGPEAGWTEGELDQFEKLDFVPFSLGERVLRVEDAITFAVGQIELLRLL